MYSIANRFNTTVDEIIKRNNLTTTVLQIGDRLIIPNYSPPVEEDNNTGNTPEGTIKYTVQSGDSLYSIAKKFNTTVNEIKSLNNLSSNLLMIGQELLIPSEQKYIIYYVKSGDNLYNIARNYNTTVSEIKKLNNLTSELLSIGQALQIPA